MLLGSHCCCSLVVPPGGAPPLRLPQAALPPPHTPPQGASAGRPLHQPLPEARPRLPGPECRRLPGQGPALSLSPRQEGPCQLRLPGQVLRYRATLQPPLSSLCPFLTAYADKPLLLWLHVWPSNLLSVASFACPLCPSAVLCQCPTTTTQSALDPARALSRSGRHFVLSCVTLPRAPIFPVPR